MLLARVAGAAAPPEPSHRYAAEKELPLSLERPRVARHGSHAAQHLAQAHLAVRTPSRSPACRSPFRLAARVPLAAQLLWRQAGSSSAEPQ